MAELAPETPALPRRPLVIGAVIFLLMIGASFFLPPIKNVDQVVEWDGNRQTDNKALGFIPYSSLSPVPDLEVSAAYNRELLRAGIEPPKSFKPTFCIRTYRKPGLDYYARARLEADPSQMEAFFGSQGFKRRFAGPGSVDLIIPHGKRRQVSITTLGPARQKGCYVLEVAISFDVE